MGYRYLIFLMIAFCCCSKQADVKVVISDFPSVAIPERMDESVEIKHWLAIGAFEFYPLLTNPQESFSRKDLKRYGIKEGWIDSQGIEKAQKKGAKVFLIETTSPQLRLFKYINGRIGNKSNFYLVSKIISEKAQEVTLITDGSCSYAVWLNGDKQIEVRGKHNLNKAGDRFTNISLKEGENLLFIKISRGTNKKSWDLICAITSLRESERIFRVNYAGDFVVNPIVNKSLEVYAGPFLKGSVEIVDEHGVIITVTSFENHNTNAQPFVISGLDRLKEGFYTVILIVGDEKIRQIIYKGDYEKFVKSIKKNVDKQADNSLYTNDLRVACQRVDYLNNRPGDPGSPSETRYLNRNRVFWAYSLHEMLQKNAATQLMTYENQKGELGVFIFHKDSKLAQNCPLVIIIPSSLQGSSMIEDWYTGNLDQIETDNTLSDEYGMAVVWIYAGGKHYSSAQTEKEITAVINRLHSVIDTQRVFITGDCEGGRRALVQLAVSPGRYAACVAASPITLSGGNDGIPINLIDKMGNIPIMIRHGREDDVSPVENSRRFFAEAQKMNLQVEYTEVAGSHVNIRKDGHRYIFEYFSQIIIQK